MVDFLSTGMMTENFRQVRTLACTSDQLKKFVKTAHVLSTFPGTPSGPAAFLGFTDPSVHLTSCSCRESTREVAVCGSRESEPSIFCLKTRKETVQLLFQ